MAGEIWCPICMMATESKRMSWLWFWIFLLFITPAFPLYLIYCLVSKDRICTRCKNRVKFYSDEADWEARKR